MRELICRLSHNAPIGGPAGELGAIRKLKLSQHRAHVRFDRLDRNEQFGRHLFIHVTTRDQPHDLLLAGGQPVQLLIMSMVIFANSRNFTVVGALALGINSGAYVSEIIRGGLMAVDPGQMEAGRSLGLNYMTTMVVIIIPQAIRAVLPALGNEFIVLLKDTSLITTIGGKELLYAAQGIMNRTYEAMFPLLGVALIYLILVMLFTWLLSKFERRLAQSDR